MKTILAPGFKARLLGMNGWFSTNILGNRDGEVLEDPGSFKSKEETKLSVLEQILQPELYPMLYKDLYHAVRINYYPPRGDSKEGWTTSTSSLARLPDANQGRFPVPRFDPRRPAGARPRAVPRSRATLRMKGIQEWLSFYFKGR